MVCIFRLPVFSTGFGVGLHSVHKWTLPNESVINFDYVNAKNDYTFSLGYDVTLGRKALEQYWLTTVVRDIAPIGVTGTVSCCKLNGSVSKKAFPVCIEFRSFIARSWNACLYAAVFLANLKHLCYSSKTFFGKTGNIISLFIEFRSRDTRLSSDRNMIVNSFVSNFVFVSHTWAILFKFISILLCSTYSASRFWRKIWSPFSRIQSFFYTRRLLFKWQWNNFLPRKYH